jgi:hypothetical protein
VPDRCDEEIGVAVVVDVRECGADRDCIGHAQAGGVGDVAELAATQVLPELRTAQLRNEENIGEAVAVDVSGRDAGAVVVVDLLVILAGVVDEMILECDPAGVDSVRKAEIVDRGRSRCGGALLGLPRQQPGGRATFDRWSCLALTASRQPETEQEERTARQKLGRNSEASQ